MFWDQKTINCRGHLLDISTPIVMGILNVTPDSFYDGGAHYSSSTADQHVEEMIDQGAAIIDVGGMSTRPGSITVDPDEELRRVLPVVKRITKLYPSIVVSIDTVHHQVAHACLSEGAHMINDVSAGSMDQKLLPTVAAYKAPYVLMHMQGVPETMQSHPSYDDELVELIDFFASMIEKIMKMGIYDIIIDPGFGFGKTLTQNYSLLSNLHVFKLLDRPILVGLSRKGMIQEVVGKPAKDCLNGTTALHMVALEQGAKILRAHDVSAAIECISLHQNISNQRRK